MLARNTTSPWVLIGDFNEVLKESEKIRGAPIDQRCCFCFRRWVNECGLINLEAAGLKFTWRGPIHQGFGKVYECLDRVYCNAD